MHFTLKEICKLTNQPSATVADICDIEIDDEGRLTVLYYYYVCLISELMRYCNIDALKTAIPFDRIAPMVEMVEEQEAKARPEPMAPAVSTPGVYPLNPVQPNMHLGVGIIYAQWTPTLLGGNERSKVSINICWRQLICDAKEALLEELLAQRAEGGAT